eukprot:31409_1
MVQPLEDSNTSIAYSHSLTNKNFLIWRCTAFIYILFVEIASIIWYGFQINKYFTNWTLFLCTLYISLSFYCTYLHYKHSENTNTDIKCIKYCKYAQNVQVLASSLSITVVIAFWALFWNVADYSDPFNPQIHGTTMLFTIIDYYICYNTVTFKSSWWFLVIFGVAYAIWSAIFVFIYPNNPIYGDILDWKHNTIGAFITVTMIVVLSIITHALLCWTNNKLIANRLRCININNNDTNHNNKMDIEQGMVNTIEMGNNLSTGSIHVANNSVELDSDKENDKDLKSLNEESNQSEQTEIP